MKSNFHRIIIVSSSTFNSFHKIFGTKSNDARGMKFLSITNEIEFHVSWYQHHSSRIYVTFSALSHQSLSHQLTHVESLLYFAYAEMWSVLHLISNEQRKCAHLNINLEFTFDVKLREGGFGIYGADIIKKLKIFIQMANGWFLK